jgi:hypothetical protein
VYDVAVSIVRAENLTRLLEAHPEGYHASERRYHSLVFSPQKYLFQAATAPNATPQELERLFGYCVEVIRSTRDRLDNDRAGLLFNFYANCAWKRKNRFFPAWQADVQREAAQMLANVEDAFPAAPAATAPWRRQRAVAAMNEIRSAANALVQHMNQLEANRFPPGWPWDL